MGAKVVSQEYVEHEEDAIAGAIVRGRGNECGLYHSSRGKLRSWTASDVTPSGILRAGGTIELYGAPVEPGNLLLLAYLENLPIIGAPGCVKSRDVNVVDLILPRVFGGGTCGEKGHCRAGKRGTLDLNANDELRQCSFTYML